jgi:energy-coupling factor transport system permease protein
MAALSELYVPGSGWLYRLDPRTRMWIALLCMALALLTSQVMVLAGVLVFSQVVLLSGGVPAQRVLKVWRTLAPVVLVILVLQPLLVPGPGPDLFRLGPVRVTSTGLLIGARYGLRVMSAAFAVLIPILTTPVNILVRALNAVGLPYTWAMTVGLAVRYLGTIGDLYASIAEAQQARGWDISRGGIVARARAVVPTLVALIVASLRLSDMLALGLAARGFGLHTGRTHGRRRTHFRAIALRRVDWAVMGAVLALFAGVLIFLP